MRIPWSENEESRLLELVAQGLDYEHIAETLNNDFKDERPTDPESGKVIKRTGKSCLWGFQNIRKREKKSGFVPTSKRQPKGPPGIPRTQSASFDGDSKFRILVTNKSGETVFLGYTKLEIDDVMEFAKKLL